MSQKRNKTQTDVVASKTSHTHKGQSSKISIGMGTLTISVLAALCVGLYLGTLLPSMVGPVAQVAPVAQQITSAPVSNATVQPKPQELTDIQKAERAVENAPENINALITLGNLYYDAQMPEKSVLAYTRALNLNPNNPNVLTDRGTMYRAMGKFAQALDSYRKAYTIDPEHQNSLFNAGIVLYFDLRRKDEARAMFEKLLAVNPSAKTPNGQSIADLLRDLQ